ncbi:MAG TPA: AMIN domain-containing protein, partial [Chroococcales cyanobacterium]
MAKKIFSLVLLVGFVSFLGNSRASAASINGISFDAKKGGIRIKLDGPGETTIRKLESPSRLLIDISNASITSGTRHVPVSDPRVKAIRMGQFSIVPAIVRVVIELAGNSDVAPSIKKASGELFISLSGGPAVAELIPVEKKKPIAAKIALTPKAKPSPL